MGIPKFYRWISERYPLINQVVKGSLRPEFDNLYLDMNGIIHMCSHPRDLDVTSESLTEDQIYAGIFEYIDRIFHLIAPKKLLFMAVDGVAPRAKMNQQRQRRFKSAKNTEEAIRQAKSEGQALPEGDRFDSNCITPGTEFMARLCRHLRYFVRKKMQEDAAWRKVRVILSGPDVPGEGEHKIMLYIRNAKMQPGYPSNLRHCMYGLDADLIMLALVTHEPHFALLREEVVFGAPRRQLGYSRKAIGKMDEFQLLHVSLLRECIDIEFRNAFRALPASGPKASKDSKEEKKDGPQQPATATAAREPYSLERVIDDWVLMCMLVGNDFIPNVPMLDIAEHGLDQMITAYKTRVLPHHGYLLRGGRIQAGAYLAFLRAVSEITGPIWTEKLAKNFAAPRRRFGPPQPTSAELEEKAAERDAENRALDMEQGGSLADEGFSTKSNLVYYRMKFKEFFRDPESRRARSRAESKASIRQLCYHYLEGIAWVYRYYYEGCCSWGWFYPYHYAPMTEELINCLTNDDFARVSRDMPLGQPYRPLEQLMSVLPGQSSKLLPEALRPLVLRPESALAEYYPSEFETDSNFKTTPWERIALIAFIDEPKLLRTLQRSGAYSRLTAEEKSRNARYGKNYIYEFDPEAETTSNSDGGDGDAKTAPRVVIRATLPSFPDVMDPVSKESEWEYPPDDPPFEPKLTKNLIQPMPGFPYIKIVKLESKLKCAHVNCFGRPSRKTSLVLGLPPLRKALAHSRLAGYFLGPRTCFTSWPYTREAVVLAVMSRDTVWSTTDPDRGLFGAPRGDSKIRTRSVPSEGRRAFLDLARDIREKFMTTKAVDVGDIELLFRVRLFEGMRRSPDGSVKKMFTKSDILIPATTVLTRNPRPDTRWDELAAPTFEQEFPKGTRVVYIGPKKELFGCEGHVLGPAKPAKGDKKQKADVARVKLTLPSPLPNPLFAKSILKSKSPRYFPAFSLAKHLGVSPSVLSKVTSSLLANPGRVEIGLQLKSTKHRKLVPGYTRIKRIVKPQQKGGGRDRDPEAKPRIIWEYSLLTAELVFKYKKAFPRLFLALQQQRSSGRFLNAETFLKRRTDNEGYSAAHVDRKTAEEALAEIQAWIKQTGISSMLAFPATSQVLARPTIAALEAAADDQLARAAQAQAKRGGDGDGVRKLDAVARRDMYRVNPGVWWTPTPTFRVGDRVVCLRTDLGVPLGARGTVVGLHIVSGDGADGTSDERHVDVLFDRKIVGGTTLNAMCSRARGKTLPANSLLNLSLTKQSRKNAGAKTAKQRAEAAADEAAERARRKARQAAAQRAQSWSKPGAASDDGPSPAPQPGKPQAMQQPKQSQPQSAPQQKKKKKVRKKSEKERGPKIKMPSQARDKQASSLIGKSKKIPRCADCTGPLGCTWEEASRMKQPFCKDCMQNARSRKAKNAKASQKSKGAKKQAAQSQRAPADDGQDEASVDIDEMFAAASKEQKENEVDIDQLFDDARAAEQGAAAAQQKPQAQQPRAAPAPGAAPPLRPGEFVMIVNLPKRPAFNGRVGRVQRFDQSISRYVVTLRNPQNGQVEVVALRATKLRRMPPPAAPMPPRPVPGVVYAQGQPPAHMGMPPPPVAYMAPGGAPVAPAPRSKYSGYMMNYGAARRQMMMGGLPMEGDTKADQDSFLQSLNSLGTEDGDAAAEVEEAEETDDEDENGGDEEAVAAAIQRRQEANFQSKMEMLKSFLG